MSRIAPFLLGMLMLCPSPLLAQGVLQRTRSQPQHDPNDKPTGPSPSDNTNGPPNKTDTTTNNWGGGDPEGLGALIGLGLLGVTSPFWAPPLLVGDDYQRPGYFPASPYPTNVNRFMYLEVDNVNPCEDQKAQLGDPDYLKPWSLRLSVENGNDFRGLNRFNGQLVFDTTSRFGARTNWNYLSEDLGDGHTDSTVLGDTNLTFRFAQSERVQMYVGAGFRVQTDRYDSRFGFNFTYGGDFFPVQPLIASASFDVGNLSNVLVLHGRGTLGVAWRGWEIFAGYDFLRIGTVNLQGPMVGARRWF